MNHLVSIVIPTYNRANRIEGTLLALAAQDYDNIEIIVVDGASSDGTCDAAENVLKSSGRKFKIIRHETNLGISAARNDGLDAASGDYVIFVDSDDLADPNFVSVLLGMATESGSDAAFCGFRVREEDTGKVTPPPAAPEQLRQYSSEELTIMYVLYEIYPFMWTHIFKTSFLKTAGLRFAPECRVGEDEEFLGKVYSRCNSINSTTGQYYTWVWHKGQTSTLGWQTPKEKILKKMNLAEARSRSARYIAEHTLSPKVRAIARNYLLPKYLIKVMSIAAAWQHDKEKFYSVLRAPETRQALKDSFKSFKREPKMVFKAAVLLAVPWLYFWARSQLSRFTRP